MPRVDIRHLNAKNALKRTVDAASAYAATMRQQNKPIDRIIVSRADYESLHRRAQSHHPNRTVFLCLDDALVHFHHGPVDETEVAPVSRYPQVPQYDLPPVSASPFGIEPAKPVDAMPANDFDDDDQAPF